MTLRVYNTLSRKKEAFNPIESKKVVMYVCGPTVYDKAHVGHAMSSLVFDIIRRYLEYRGYTVRHVMNFTDVDDKIIQRAGKNGVDPVELAEKYIREYQHHLRDLNVLTPTIMPRATEEMSNIIDLVHRLVVQGSAYEKDGDVYFRVTSVPDYGKLSRRNLEDMQAGARVEIDPRKEHPMDFALWKSAKPGDPAWESPWGAGRPGWHIECSAMNLRHLGEQIDIHGGGNDLIFPHHENEIAQTESITRKSFARYWIHNGMLQFSGEKMSKSIGNLVTIEDFLSEHDSDVLRLVILNSNYRNPLTFNEDVIDQATHSLDRLKIALRPVREKILQNPNDDLREQMIAAQRGFIKVMDDDFNTAGALGHIFNLVRAINQAKDLESDADAIVAAQTLLRELSGVLGLRLQEKTEASVADPFIDLLIDIRNEMRHLKHWQLADSIRDRLVLLGVTLEDTKDSTDWFWE